MKRNKSCRQGFFFGGTFVLWALLCGCLNTRRDRMFFVVFLLFFYIIPDSLSLLFLINQLLLLLLL
jgi:hypothetical protein